jgi:hypothetical protein
VKIASHTCTPVHTPVLLWLAEILSSKRRSSGESVGQDTRLVRAGPTLTDIQPMSQFVRAITALWIVLAVGCGSDSGSPTNVEPPLVPTNLGATTGQNLTSIAGDTMRAGVVLTDAHGAAMSGRGVTFVVVSGGGTVSPSVVITDAGGRASAIWTAGPASGTHTLSATITPIAPLVFTATVHSLVDGSWSGTTGGQTLTLTLVENSNVVTGTGLITNTPTGTRALVVTGTYSAPSATLTMSSGSTSPFNLKATATTKTLAGAMNGSGFTGEIFVLTRM